MKRISIIFSIIILGSLSLFSQNVSIPDANFLAALIAEGVDTNSDGQISYAEAEAVTKFEITNKDISDLTGIEAFVNLEQLFCGYNQLTSLDVSNNTALADLRCGINHLSNLDVSNNINLEHLECHNNELTSLDVSNNNALRALYCYNNQLTSLDVSDCIALEYELDCSSNNLSTLDLTENVALERLNCSNNQLTSLDVSNNTALMELACCYNQLITLDISNNIELVLLGCTYNQLSNLDVSACNSLKGLDCSNNQLKNLDISGCLSLYDLRCSNNLLSSLNVIENVALHLLDCSYNQLSSLDVSYNPELIGGRCYYKKGASTASNNHSEMESIEDGCIERFGYFHAMGGAVNPILILSGMPTLQKVCVEPDMMDTAQYYSEFGCLNITGSPNINFDTLCVSNINTNSDNLIPSKTNHEITIYPNPTDGIITIDICNPLNADIEIYNTNGSLIYSKPLQSAQEQIDLTAYPKGLYFVIVRQQGVVKVGKVVLE